MPAALRAFWDNLGVEITRASAASEVQRCPFCHENVSEADPQVACKRCLARHHALCWSEGGCCSSCHAPTPLVQQGPAPPIAAGEVVAPVARAPDDVRRE